ncbi:MAG: hypothetical protein M0R22_02560, partial [Dehalococcoidia bacterium]|nr:hypothetical protein [Dehalococcoidia bacterium]
MNVRRRFGLLTASMAAVLLLPFGAVAADAPDKTLPGGPALSSEIDVVSNGIYKVSIFNEESSEPGIFTVGTGDEHPHADADMLYGGGDESPGTSYLSVYDYTGEVVYTSDYSFSSEEPSGGYAIAYMGAWGVEFDSGQREASTLWSPGDGDLEVEQEVEVLGSSISDSAVRVTTKVTNRTGGTREVGIRYFWDMMVADEDGVWYATRDPKTTFSQDERIYTPPT